VTPTRSLGVPMGGAAKSDDGDGGDTQQRAEFERLIKAEPGDGGGMAGVGV